MVPNNIKKVLVVNHVRIDRINFPSHTKDAKQNDKHVGVNL